jgi:hypothetical protein
LSLYVYRELGVFDNAIVRESISGVVLELLSRRDVTSRKDSWPSCSAQGLTSAGIVSPVTAINENQPAIGTGHSIPSADDSFVTIIRKGRAQLPDSLLNPTSNLSKKSRSPVIGVRSSSSLSAVARRVKTKALLTPTPNAGAKAEANPRRITVSTAGYESTHTAAAQSRLDGGTAALLS